MLVRVADVPRQGQAPGDLAEVGPAMVVGLPARLHRRDVASGKVVHFAQLPGQAPARCGFPHRKPVVSPGTFTAAAIDPMVVALTLLGHEEAGEFGAEFGDVGPEAAQLELGRRDRGVHGVRPVHQRLPLTGVVEMGRDRVADWIKNNHRASNGRHVASEDDADAAAGRNRQPQWAQVGDVGVVPEVGKDRLGMCSVSRKSVLAHIVRA